VAPSTETVTVGLDQRGYDIEIGTGILVDCASMLLARHAVEHAVVITDTNVEQPYADPVARRLAEHVEVDLLTVDAGEPSKSIDTAEPLWDALLEAGADRRTTVIAVGGGVVGDLAGFIAATYARGLAFIQIPTTLLAQVDSSVGGKVGINLAGAKNMVGAFWQPRLVLIDTDVLKTLPDREYRAGLAEVVKYGVILDAEFFAFLEANAEAINQRQDDVLRRVVARCCQLKADVVRADEREQSGQRATLNYGHTFAHALETLSGYGEWLHGEAVSIGMLCASRLAEALGMIDAATTQRQHDLLAAFQLPVAMPDVDAEQFLSTMQRDKKVERGRIRFVLPTQLGHVQLVSDPDPRLVKRALQAG
jgi:3-dehydroquinate synthase